MRERRTWLGQKGVRLRNRRVNMAENQQRFARVAYFRHGVTCPDGTLLHR
jgi:hypothetical protein